VSKRVLVVDDDTAVRRLVRTVLAREGYQVDEAYGGREALEKIAWDGYDAIVLDLMMPEISGFDVLSAISQVRPYSECGVVISAAASQRIGESESPLIRARLRKPFEISDLVAAVRGCSNSDTRRASS